MHIYILADKINKPFACYRQLIFLFCNQSQRFHEMPPMACFHFLLLGLEQGTAMGLVTGSFNANLCALVAARSSLLQGLGYDIMRNGLRNAPPLRVLVSEDAHASVKAALSVLGFGFEEVELLPTDEYRRIRTEAVPEMDSRTLCVVQAGNVNGGSKWKGRSIIRVSVCSHATMREDIDKSVIVFRNALHGEV